MIAYSENKNRHRSTFTKSIVSDEGEILSQRTVVCPMYFIDYNDFTYIVLYDDYMNIIHEAFEYLNYDMREYPVTTRRSAAHAIRFLYCYLSLSGYSVKKMNQAAFDGLKLFLRGIGTNVDGHSLVTIRSGATVNTYLSVYRAYFKKRKIKCEPLFKSHRTKAEVKLGDDYAQNVTRLSYDNNVKTRSPEQNEVPKYISPDEFRRIYSLALDNNDRTAMLILHLMYGYGLRLGEVLGITIEDITEVYDNNRLVPVIILRNRISDKTFQFAKNLMHPISREQYRNDMEYKKSQVKIHITYELYEALIEYVNTVHEYMAEKYPKNYEKGIADIVSYRDIPEFNHYVFLNQYGNILSDQTWNNKLKKYYEQANIPLDYGIKKDNLAHRLRHGFAMFHAHFSKNPVDVLKLKKMMRHKQVTSTMVYYNPTDEEILKIKTEFQEELYSMIPELKGVI